MWRCMPETVSTWRSQYNLFVFSFHNKVPGIEFSFSGLAEKNFLTDLPCEPQKINFKTIFYSLKISYIIFLRYSHSSVPPSPFLSLPTQLWDCFLFPLSGRVWVAQRGLGLGSALVCSVCGCGGGHIIIKHGCSSASRHDMLKLVYWWSFPSLCLFLCFTINAVHKYTRLYL